MVSLYRAWAAWRGIGIPGIPGAPDALIQVGGVRFTAHARLLAAHSGYFKSVLPRQWNYPSAEDHRPYEDGRDGESYETEYERERRELETRYGDVRNENGGQLNEENVVYVPNITAQQFWPLLAYMYTGYLELTPENIYQVLLATHLLHMPRALELCRNFLSQGTTAATVSQTLPSTIIKPIPSRKLPNFLSAPIPYRPIFPETPIQYLGAAQQYETPFKPVESSTFTSRLSVNEASTSAANSSQEESRPLVSEDGKVQNILQQNTENKKDNETNNEETRHVRDNNLVPVNLVKAKRVKPFNIKKSKEDDKKDLCSNDSSENVVIIKEKPDFRIAPSADEKVIIDVACCDGPVRFHRVLNKAYKSNDSESNLNVADSSDSDDSYVEIEEDSRSHSETPYDNCNAFSKSLQKQMSENIRNMTGKQNENHPGYETTEDGFNKVDGQDDASNSLLSNKSQETIYTCVYCNHTFKSQYCYQKHARRHINPVSIDAVNQGTVEFTPDECCKAKKIGIKVNPSNSGPKREVRLLDMNVQYYPCKTCGSKFPSYYFVHKHRKMCHAEELEGSVELTNKQISSVSQEKKRKLSEVQINDGGEDINKQPDTNA